LGNVVNNRILLKVWVGRAGESPDPEDLVTALLDTGATISGISKNLVELVVAELSLPDSSEFDVILGMDFLHPFHLTVYKGQFILSN